MTVALDLSNAIGIEQSNDLGFGTSKSSVKIGGLQLKGQ